MNANFTPLLYVFDPNYINIGQWKYSIQDIYFWEQTERNKMLFVTTFQQDEVYQFFLERYNNEEEIMYMGVHDFLSSLMEFCVSNKVGKIIPFISDATKIF